MSKSSKPEGTTPEERVWTALRRNADHSGRVSGTAEDLLEWLGLESAGVDVHAMLIRLNRDGYFRSAHFGGAGGEFSFSVTLVQRGARTPEDRVWAALCAQADSSGVVSGTQGQLREWLGADASWIDVHETLIHLKKDGRFRSAHLEGSLFEVTLRS